MMARFHVKNGERVPFTPKEEAEFDARQAAVIAAQPINDVLAEITRLERLETPRRLAEAVLTTEGKTWLANNRALIAAERAKL
ncbi:MAG TPA: hypothetical protein DCG72_08945 [Gammaproteobacteria bacterium]|jgi:hypothetical protein|nr:hypothetical protein [Gammaproteobacteria bacterium]